MARLDNPVNRIAHYCTTTCTLFIENSEETTRIGEDITVNTARNNPSYYDFVFKNDLKLND